MAPDRRSRPRLRATRQTERPAPELERKPPRGGAPDAEARSVVQRLDAGFGRSHERGDLLRPDRPTRDDQRPLADARDGLGPDFSETVLYLSDEPFQIVAIFMTIVSGEIEKAANRAFFRDQEALEEQFLAGFLEGAGEVEPTIRWSDPSVGDTAKLASITTDFEGVEVREEFLFFVLEEESEAADVLMLSVWLPGGATDS